MTFNLNYHRVHSNTKKAFSELKADKLKLNILQPTFGPVRLINGDDFYHRNIIADY